MSHKSTMVKGTTVPYPHLKNATLEMLRSSRGVRDDAKIDLNTAGVTGLRFFSSETGETGATTDGGRRTVLPDDAVEGA
ncbi:hypothetical protein FRC09_002407 [Ceratobasidium sp. 395]|nr:hypothetical protein FRC09_002407 [Ceratobasidium sp. 395]